MPAPNTENDDHNPPRIAPRNLFDVAVGDDNLFKGDHYRWSLTLTAINVTNKYGAVQLPFNLQRHALRDAANADGSTRVPLLTPSRERAPAEQAGALFQGSAAEGDPNTAEHLRPCHLESPA